MNHLSSFVVTNNDRLSNYDTNCISERDPDNLQQFIFNELPYLQLMTKRKFGIIEDQETLYIRGLSQSYVDSAKYSR